MPNQFSIHVPDQQIDAIKRFMTINLNELEKIVQCVSEAVPSQDVEDLAETCQTITNIPIDAIDSVISIAINLNILRRNIKRNPEEITKLVSEALGKRLKDWNNDGWEERAALLQRLLVSDGTIEIMAKARTLLGECQSIYLDSSVLTDVRYIYNKDATAVLGGLILNTLVIDFLEGEDRKHLHVVISGKEIKSLITQLQRSQQKIDVTTELLLKHSLAELTPKRDEEQ